jgi:methyl-accepting chemotaxis protein
MLVILAVVAAVAMFKVQTIDAALRVNSEQNALIQRYAINFRGSAHDRAIAVRDVVLAADPACAAPRRPPSTNWRPSTPSRPDRWKR